MCVCLFFAKHLWPPVQRKAAVNCVGNLRHLCVMFIRCHGSSKDSNVACIEESITVVIGIQWTGDWTPRVQPAASSVPAGSARTRLVPRVLSGVGLLERAGREQKAGWVVQEVRSEANWVDIRRGRLP